MAGSPAQTLYAELRPPFGSPGTDHRTAAAGFHSHQKAVSAFAPDNGRLVGAFHVYLEILLSQNAQLDYFLLNLSIKIYPDSLWITPSKRNKMLHQQLISSCLICMPNSTTPADIF